MLDTNTLVAFVGIVDQGSFSRAAEKLHLSQPAISKRIAVLERELGCPVFDRINRSIRLTDAGEILNRRARIILQDLNDISRRIHDLDQGPAGRLHLATTHHIGQWRLSAPLTVFTQQFPDVHLDMSFLDSDVAYQQVQASELDLALVTFAPGRAPAELVHQAVWHDPLVITCAQHHPLAEASRRETISMDQLLSFEAVLPDTTTYTGRIARDLFANHARSLQVHTSTNYLETIRMLVSIGLGWSLLPASMVDEDLCILPQPELRASRTLGFIHHSRRSLSRAAQAFIDTVMASARGSGDAPS